jgi:hypothetical protein
MLSSLCSTGYRRRSLTRTTQRKSTRWQSTSDRHTANLPVGWKNRSSRRRQWTSNPLNAKAVNTGLNHPWKPVLRRSSTPTPHHRRSNMQHAPPRSARQPLLSEYVNWLWPTVKIMVSRSVLFILTVFFLRLLLADVLSFCDANCRAFICATLQMQGVQALTVDAMETGKGDSEYRLNEAIPALKQVRSSFIFSVLGH